MTHTFKKFTPLFLAGLLCISAAPARSAESWSSFTLKGIGTWAAYVGIGLGSTIAHEYSCALAAEFLYPGSVNHIAIGPCRTSEDLRVDRPFLKPVLSFDWFSALGIFQGRTSVRFDAWRSSTVSVVGPLAASAFSLGILAATHSLLQKQGAYGVVIGGSLCGHALENVMRLITHK